MFDVQGRVLKVEWPLAQRLGLDLLRVSNHLARLRMMGFVHAHRHGKQVHYEIAPETVRLDRGGGGGGAGELRLTLTGAGGVFVTLGVPVNNRTMEEASATEPVLSLSKDGARMDIDGHDTGSGSEGDSGSMR